MMILMLAPMPYIIDRGSPLHVYFSLKALSTLGHKVHIVTYHIGRTEAIPNVYVHRIPFLPLHSSIKPGPNIEKPLLDLLLLKRATHLLRTFRFDLVYAHNVEGALLGAVLKKFLKIPLVYDIHAPLSFNIETYTGSIFLKFFSPLVEMLERRLYDISDSIIALSPLGQQHIAQTCPSKASSILVVPEFIDDRFFDNYDGTSIRKRYSLEGFKVVIYTGNFSRIQGVDLLVKAFSQVVKLRKDVRLLLVGDAISRIRSLVEKENIKDFVIFAGMHSVKEMPCFLAASDICVSPRLWGKASSGKVLTYMSAGKAIIVTDVPCHSQFSEWRECMIFQKPEVHNLSDSISYLVENDSLRKELGLRAKAMARREFSFVTTLRCLEDALERPYL